MKFCNDNETVRIEMPKKGSFVKFNDRQNQFNPIRPGGGSEARMAKLTAANQKPLIL